MIILTLPTKVINQLCQKILFFTLTFGRNRFAWEILVRRGNRSAANGFMCNLVEHQKLNQTAAGLYLVGFRCLTRTSADTCTRLIPMISHIFKIIVMSFIIMIDTMESDPTPGSRLRTHQTVDFLERSQR